VGGEEFAGLLAGLFFDREGRGIAEAGMKQVVATLKAVGRKGECHAVFCRVARLQDSIEIDLGDDSWQAVLISPDGWEVGQTSARFIRTRNTGALPVPERGGHVELLRPLVNVRDEDWPLFVGSILDAYKGHGPYFVSVFSGEQGSGKSTLVRMLTRLIDPVKSAELLTLPRDERDGAVVAKQSHLLGYDNVSKLHQWQSDFFCRLSTGGGLRTRALYSDDGVAVFDCSRPVSLNGIEDFVVAGNLASRCVTIQAQVIPESSRKDERSFWAEFDKVKPLALGGLYDALSEGLSYFPTTTLESKPRMADGARWVAACCTSGSVGFDYAAWDDSYREATSTAQETTLEHDLAGRTLRGWFKGRDEWVGTPGDLHAALLACVAGRDERFFPASPQSLTNHLTRCSPALRQQGIHIDRPNGKKWIDGSARRVIVVSRKPAAETTAATGDNPAGGSRRPLPTLPTLADLENEVRQGKKPIKQGKNDNPSRTSRTFSLSSSEEEEEGYRPDNDDDKEAGEKLGKFGKFGKFGKDDENPAENGIDSLPNSGNGSAGVRLGCEEFGKARSQVEVEERPEGGDLASGETAASFALRTDPSGERTCPAFVPAEPEKGRMSTLREATAGAIPFDHPCEVRPASGGRVQILWEHFYDPGRRMPMLPHGTHQRPDGRWSTLWKVPA